MVGRPPKYKRGRPTSVYTDETDLKYLDEHRGKLSRSEYLIEAMYALKGDTRIQVALTLVKAKDKEIYELKRQLLFEQSKNKKQAPEIEINEAGLIKFYEDKRLGELITKFGSSINWQNLFDKNIEQLSGSVNDAKELQKWCMNYYYRNNSVKNIQGVDKHQVG
jgi:hypothetical protein